MNYFAKLSGTRIVGVIGVDDEPTETGLAPIPGPAQWSDRPSLNHQPHLEDGAITWLDDRPIDDARAQAWERVKAARTAAIDAPLATPYGSFDCGPGDRTNITDAISLMQTMQAASNPITVDFTVRDNSTVTLTTAQMVNVGLLLGQKVQGAYATGRILRAQIDSPTVTKEELDEISWP